MTTRRILKGAIGIAVMTTALTALGPAPAASAATVYGCPSGAVCIYPGANWSGTPLKYCAYGAHNLSGQYGTKRIFNNHTGGATMRTCTGYNGAGCQGFLPANQYLDKNMTPINSIVLVRP